MQKEVDEQDDRMKAAEIGQGHKRADKEIGDQTYHRDNKYTLNYHMEGLKDIISPPATHSLKSKQSRASSDKKKQR